MTTIQVPEGSFIITPEMIDEYKDSNRKLTLSDRLEVLEKEDTSWANLFKNDKNLISILSKRK